MQQLESLRRVTKSKADDRNFFGFFLLLSLGLGTLNLLMSLGLWIAYSGVANKKPPTLVQAVDGRAMVVNSMESRDRTPVVIRKFVADSLVLLLSSSGKLPSTMDKAGELDQGVPVEIPGKGQRKVSTSAWQASFALSEDFRPSALQAVAVLTPPGSFAGQAQMMLVPVHIGDPEKVAEGQWQVHVIANLMTVSVGTTQGVSVPFNKTIYLRSIDTPTPTDASGPLERAVYGIRQSGLEIFAMKDYTPGNIKPQ
jgi:hypothetical protein